MSQHWWCDECEALIEAESEYQTSPKHVTDGDHYWCDECWAGLLQARQARYEAETEREEGDEGPA